MKMHPFILQPGVWLGEGKIEFSSELKEIKFYARWTVKAENEGLITATQEVELAGSQEKTKNIYRLSKIEEHAFSMHLENEIFGTVIGRGIISPEAIAWEFHGNELEFEGFEVYQLLPDGCYRTRAEYASKGEPHTVISGIIWKKTED